MIQKLHGLEKTLVIATTTKRANMDIYRHLNDNIRSKAPLDKYFTAIYTREDVSSIKPSPEVHEKLMTDLEKTREDCFILKIPWQDSWQPGQRAFRQALSMTGIQKRTGIAWFLWQRHGMTAGRKY